jgi:hypothetical protein
MDSASGHGRRPCRSTVAACNENPDENLVPRYTHVHMYRCTVRYSFGFGGCPQLTHECSLDACVGTHSRTTVLASTSVRTRFS